MFTKGQRIELTISDLAEGTKCFGKLDEGMAVFVHGPAAVGDRVAATVFKIKKNYLEADLAEVLAPSPSRVKPACEHFGVCGGCKWQHVVYAEQLRVKRKLVADALAHVGGFADAAVAEPLASSKVFGYRNKMEFSFSNQRYLLEEEVGLQEEALAKPKDFALGFHSPGRFDKVVDIDLCHISPDEMNSALALVKQFCRDRKIPAYSARTHEGFLRHLMVRKAFATGEFMVNLVTSSHDPALMRELDAVLPREVTTFVNNVTTRKSNVAFGEQEFVLRGPGTITERLGRFQFRISANSFFQTNTAQAEVLYRTTLEAAGLQGGETVFDLYCGTGTISLFVSDHCRRVIGFEMEPSSIADAGKNAEFNGVGNCRFVHMDLKHLDHVADEAPDVVITDPPRAGMHPKAVEKLLEMKPRRIVYVSCNPASLARDAQMLCAQGAYRLGDVQPVDLFPHTYHIESVAVLDRT